MPEVEAVESRKVEQMTLKSIKYKMFWYSVKKKKIKTRDYTQYG